jgi:hypothetical protein
MPLKPIKIKNNFKENRKNRIIKKYIYEIGSRGNQLILYNGI